MSVDDIDTLLGGGLYYRDPDVPVPASVVHRDKPNSPQSAPSRESLNAGTTADMDWVNDHQQEINRQKQLGDNEEVAITSGTLFSIGNKAGSDGAIVMRYDELETQEDGRRRFALSTIGAYKGSKLHPTTEPAQTIYEVPEIPYGQRAGCTISNYDIGGNGEFYQMPDSVPVLVDGEQASIPRDKEANYPGGILVEKYGASKLYGTTVYGEQTPEGKAKLHTLPTILRSGSGEVLDGVKDDKPSQTIPEVAVNDAESIDTIGKLRETINNIPVDRLKSFPKLGEGESVKALPGDRVVVFVGDPGGERNSALLVEFEDDRFSFKLIGLYDDTNRLIPANTGVEEASRIDIRPRKNSIGFRPNRSGIFYDVNYGLAETDADNFLSIGNGLLTNTSKNYRITERKPLLFLRPDDPRNDEPTKLVKSAIPLGEETYCPFRVIKLENGQFPVTVEEAPSADGSSGDKDLGVTEDKLQIPSAEERPASVEGTRLENWRRAQRDLLDTLDRSEPGNENRATTGQIVVSVGSLVDAYVNLGEEAATSDQQLFRDLVNFAKQEIRIGGQELGHIAPVNRETFVKSVRTLSSRYKSWEQSVPEDRKRQIGEVIRSMGPVIDNYNSLAEGDRTEAYTDAVNTIVQAIHSELDGLVG